jgi:hypothetical protein
MPTRKAAVRGGYLPPTVATSDLGNHHMIAGDVIAILFGLHVPCVLRPLSDKPEDGYAFIGEAYVHGAMNGEAVKDLPKGADGLVAGVEILLR